MIYEALKYLKAIADESAKPVELAIPDPLAKRYMVGKEVVQVPTPAAPRTHCVNSLADVIAMTEELNHSVLDTCQSAVFVDESHVICVLDYHGHRANLVTFELQQSDIWATVLGMGTWRDQKAFVQLLKVKLACALPESALLDTIRKVKFENGVATQSEIKKNRESLGKEITSKVETPLDIPDFVTLEVPVYKSLGERDSYGLACSVEIDPVRQEAFRLAPLPDEIERVQHLAIGSILARLRGSLPDGVPSYYGSP